MKKLTKSQQKIYDFLRKRMTCGVSPSVREICAATGLRSSSTVHAHLRNLENAGYITREAGHNRTIRLSGQARVVQVPIVEQMAADASGFTIEEISGYVPFSSECHPDKELFALKIQDESMKNAGILPGDYVVAEKSSMPLDGDLVVEMAEQEIALKRFAQQPENAAEALVLGRLVAVIRYY